MKGESNEWQILVWHELYKADGSIINITKVLKKHNYELEGYKVKDFFDYLKENKFIRGVNSSQARITPEGKGHYLATIKPQNTITEKNILEVIDKSKLANYQFDIELTEMDCAIRDPNSKMYFTWRRESDGNYQIGWQPYADQPEKKVKEPLSWLKTWLSLVEQNITLEGIKIKKSKPSKKHVIKHALSTNKSDTILLSKGYKNQGLIGYVDKTVKKGSLPLYSRYNKTTDEYIDLFEPEIEDREKGISSDYHLLGNVRVKRFKIPF